MASTRLALIIIIGLIISLAAGNLGYSQVFSTKFFFGLNLLFFLNLTFCTAKKAAVLVKGFRNKARGRGKGMNLNTSGTVLFHLGISVVTAGALLSTFFGFAGKFGIVEGEFFNEMQDRYTFTDKGILAGQYQKDLGVFLHNLEIVEVTSNRPYVAADVSIMENGTEQKRVQMETGESREYREVTLTFDSFGYFLTLYLSKDGTGKAETIGLDTVDDAGYHRYVRNIAMDRYQFQMEFFPDLTANRQPLRTSSYRLKNPALYLRVTNKNSVGNDDTRVVFKGVLKPGDIVQFNDGTKLSFQGYRKWAAFLLTKYNGIYFVYTGLILAVAGLVFRYWVVFKCRQ